MGMNVNLTPPTRGTCACEGELWHVHIGQRVVREALRLMDEQDRLRQAKLDELRREVRKGLDSGSSEQWDAAAVKTKARARRTVKPTAA